MNINNEFDFLKDITLGLLNKNGVSFELKTKSHSAGGKNIQILIVNGAASTHGNHQRIYISYLTSKETVYVNFKNIDNSFYGASKDVPKEEVRSYIQEWINSPEGRGNKEFSNEEGKVDFYSIIEALSEEAFASEDLFELNGWKKDIYLHKNLNAKYGTLIDTYSVHGGVGSAKNIDFLHDITTNIEMGISPHDGKNYLGVISSIAENPVYTPGVYENATPEMFVSSVIEQFKGAWNNKQV